MLNRDLHQKIIDALKHVPMTSQADGRDVLLQGIPTNIIDSLQRSSNRDIDLNKIVTQLDHLGYLEDEKTRPLIIFLENAQKSVAETSVGKDLENIIRDIAK